MLRPPARYLAGEFMSGFRSPGGNSGFGGGPGLRSFLSPPTASEFSRRFPAHFSAGRGGRDLGLVVSLSDPDPLVRERAAEALGRIGPAAAPAIQPLIAMFAYEDPYLGGAAASRCGQIGPAAVPPLVEALTDERAEMCVGRPPSPRPVRPSAPARHRRS